MKQLESCDALVLDRASMEQLFRVRRRRAIHLMLEFGAQRCGKALIVSRSGLLAELRRLSEEPAFQQEWRRRSKLSSRVQQLHEVWQARSVRLDRPSAASGSASLPQGAELHAGNIRIAFESPGDLVQKLFDIAALAARNWSAFENLINSSLPPAT
jgi:hypothetical protein